MALPWPRTLENQARFELAFGVCPWRSKCPEREKATRRVGLAKRLQVQPSELWEKGKKMSASGEKECAFALHPTARHRTFGLFDVLVESSRCAGGRSPRMVYPSNSFFEKMSPFKALGAARQARNESESELCFFKLHILRRTEAAQVALEQSLRKALEERKESGEALCLNKD